MIHYLLTITYILAQVNENVRNIEYFFAILKIFIQITVFYLHLVQIFVFLDRILKRWYNIP